MSQEVFGNSFYEGFMDRSGFVAGSVQARWSRIGVLEGVGVHDGKRVRGLLCAHGVHLVVQAKFVLQKVYCTAAWGNSGG